MSMINNLSDQICRAVVLQFYYTLSKTIKDAMIVTKEKKVKKKNTACTRDRFMSQKMTLK